MQAISTKFLGPTNARGARYKATCDAGSVTVDCDYALDSQANHERAARALIQKLGWFHDAGRGDRYGDWFGGGTADGYVFVNAQQWTRLAPSTTPAPPAVTPAELAAVFGRDWLRLSASDRALIVRDCTEGGGVTDLAQYRRNIGPGNLEAYARTQRVRFAREATR